MDAWPLSFVALAPLIVAMRGQTPKRAAGLGWAAGFTMTMVGFYWLLEMLKVFGGFNTPLALLFMVILCAYQGGRIALLGYLYGRAEKRGWHPGLVFALAFVASELVYPLLFPWYYGATVHNAVLFLQVADLGGPYLVALVLIAVNLAVAEIAFARLDKRSFASIDRRVVAAALIAPGLAMIYGNVRLVAADKAAAAGEKLKIGIVQGNQPLVRKPRALVTHTKRTEELRKAGVDLVIWSEGASAIATRETPGNEELRGLITNHVKVPAIIGTIIIGQSSDPSKTGPKKPRGLYNAAVLTDGKGNPIGRYDKQFLLAFGEYLPFGETFPVLYKYSPNSSQFKSGTSLEPLVFGKYRLSTLICYEDIIPSFVNKMVRHANPDLLVNITNDAWFGDSTEPWIHLALAKLRAVEHRRYLVRSTNSGVSAIVDPVGRVPLVSRPFKEESLIGVVSMLQAKTVYGMIGDAPWYVATLVILAMGFVTRRRPS